MRNIFEMDSLLEACYAFCNMRTPLVEMAINKSKLEGQVQTSMSHALEHFIKCVSMPSHTASNHWKSEIKNDFNQYQYTILAHNKRAPTAKEWDHYAHHDSLADYDIRHVEGLHKKITKLYPSVNQIDHEKVSSAFGNLMKHAFGKIARNDSVENEDLNMHIDQART